MNSNSLRQKTKPIFINDLQIGGNNKIVIQSMCNIKTSKTNEVLKQINQLFLAGCELIRVSILDKEDIESLKILTKQSPIPIVADIHFEPSLAIQAIEAGVKKIRLNPGNINDKNSLKKICNLAKQKKVAIRIGVNSGSLPIDLLKEYGKTAKTMILATKRYIELFETNNFFDIIISLKSEDPFLTMEAYREATKIFNYPLHLGVTEAGIGFDGVIKSCVGIIPLLLEGIGNTLRISLTDDPLEEIYVAKKLLNVLNLRQDMVDIISCPTCGRLEYDMRKIVKEIKAYTINCKIPLKISILGCVVNGIGEGKHADIGIAGNKDKCILFKNGEIFKVVDSFIVLEEFKKLIDIIIEEKKEKTF